MARTPLPYSTENTLGKLLSLLQAKRISEKGGMKVNISEVEQEVADYCGVSRDTIVMIKRGLNQPSLPVAMKIAEFFDSTVEDIFSLKTIICEPCGEPWDGVKTKADGKGKSRTILPVCQKCDKIIT